MNLETDLLLVIFLLLSILFYRRLWKENEKLRTEIENIRSAKQSLSVRYGKMTEQFMPFLNEYPYDSQNFRFIGTPIDGIQFENDEVVFVEFKVSDSKLSENQKKIKSLIEKKKVRFEEIRMGNRKRSKNHSEGKD